MARRQVVELACDPCGRVETQPAELHGQTRPSKFELEVSFNGQEVKYEDLCRRCRNAVENYFHNMTKQPEEEVEKEAEPEKSKATNFLGMPKKAG